ncbi:uncharacterized protein B0H64DRAFT_438037 [Chaetomium fimeti]|uniref:histidine kinase n=1 Tax=Chaetomium fimeti TaxID=1854472 RepID=A0AAE0HQY0_9PEZI|nr:hypothetical protein B0H64DRAFT_438037 [Chaetomium fimeti]
MASDSDMANDMLRELFPGASTVETRPICDPSSDGGEGTASDRVGELEKQLATLTRFHSCLLYAVAMARMAVFAVDNNQGITMAGGASSLARHPSNTGSSDSTPYIGENVYNAFRRLISGPADKRIPPFFGYGRQYRAHFGVPRETPGPGGHTKGTGPDCAMGYVIDTTPFRGQTQPSRNDNDGYTAVDECAAGLGDQALNATVRLLQTQVASVVSVAERLLADKQLAQWKLQEQIQGLADALLTLVRYTSDLPSARPINIQFSVPSVIKEIFEALQPLAENKGLLFRFDIADDVSIGFEVMGNPGHLQRLLSSLLRNIIKATCVGDIRLLVSKEQGDSGSTILRFVITDTARIGGASSPAGPLGTMEWACVQHELGLCKAMVEAMNGRMSFNSAAGTGTTTIIRIPFNLPASKACPPRFATPPYSPFL